MSRCRTVLYTLVSAMPKPYIPRDAWAVKAAQEGYRARSVYKLQELDSRFHLLRHGMTVLDIGAAPGSWLQYVSRQIGEKGRALGLDLQAIDAIAPHVITEICDITDEAAVERSIAAAKLQQVDLMLSDIAPNTSGIKDVDQWRSIELCQHVLEIARRHLTPRGSLVMKVFRGADFDEFLASCRSQYARVTTISVKASRDRSKEVYVVCR